MEYPTESIKNVVEALSKLPGIGKKTSLRLTLHLMQKSPQEVEELATALYNLHKSTFRCKNCNHLSDQEICNICNDTKRDSHLLCVVEEVGDLLAIEKTGYFKGRYHVLGGKISPLEGIGPNQLSIPQLIKRIQTEEIHEIIMALSTTQEGETTAFYLSREILSINPNITLSHIAKGIPSGASLEFTDEITLSKSLIHRSQYSTLNSINS
jgi:recombination protein RecR